MCFYYSLTKSIKDIETSYNAKFIPENFDITESFSKNVINAFTFPNVPIILNDTSRKIILAQWGLVPNWIKSKEDARKIKKFNLNARAETIFQKPSFKIPILQKKCIILIDGFYEWMHLNNIKYPFFIYKKNKELMNIVGIYDFWIIPKTNNIFISFSIITVHANKLLSKIHNTKQRMPLIIDKHNVETWLNNNTTLQEIKKIMT